MTRPAISPLDSSALRGIEATAMRDGVFSQSEASPQVVSEAKDNMAGFVLADGSMSSNQSGEGDIRRAITPSYTLCD